MMMVPACRPWAASSCAAVRDARSRSEPVPGAGARRSASAIERRSVVGAVRTVARRS
jgi:hypothetical protein